MKNILLAISGLTPQIVTEMLYALSIKKNIIIDEIFIVTTKRGKMVLEGKDKSTSASKTTIKNEIKNLCSYYKINQPKFNLSTNVIIAEEESIELFDIKTDKENRLFPNKLAILIKRLTANSSTNIHASLSGGRKSMSAHLALVMSLFARSQDKLYHVLTDEKFEFKNFYPKTREEENALTVAEIPFVRLRCINDPLLKEEISYSKLVAKTQEKLRFLTEDAKLIIELKKQTIRYKDKSVQLTTTEIAFYSKFVITKINLNKGIKKSEIQSNEFASELSQFLKEHFNYYIDERDKKHWSRKGLEDKYFLSIKSKINKKIEQLLTGEDIASEFVISTNKIYGDSSYIINAPKDKLGINYE